MNIALLCSAFNGLTQRAWIELCDAGHDVTVRVAGDAAAICADVADLQPELIVCPFLRQRVPADVWENYRTIIIHPGPPGDRGPSSLDWAITETSPQWGVTAMQAVEDMDAGPIWASRCFDVPADPPRKSSLYNGAVADAAIQLIHEVVTKAADPTFVPEPLNYDRADVWGQLRPTIRQADREFSWSDSTAHIVRRVRAADGSPGVQTELCGIAVAVFDASPGPASHGPASRDAVGTVAGRRHGSVLVRTGDGSVWIGHVKRPVEAGGAGVKLAVSEALADRLVDVPQLLEPAGATGHQEIGYRRIGDVGELRFDFYNGAMSTRQCRRLVLALRRAIADDTKVLVIGGGESFSNGIHLNVIHAAADPAGEAWRNIVAIDDVCRQIIMSTNKIVISSLSGNAGAGGVMAALGADRVVLRHGVVLNPHYKTMGLFGSEYWTYVLPRRVGHERATQLTEQCLPVGSAEALEIGLADDVLPGAPAEFAAAILDYAARLAGDEHFEQMIEIKRAARADDERRRPLEAYRIQELAEMSRDIFDDRNGFAAARQAFVTKASSGSTPEHLLAPAPDRLKATPAVAESRTDDYSRTGA